MTGDLRGVAGGDGELECLHAPVVMAPPIHLGTWSMALIRLPFGLLYTMMVIEKGNRKKAVSILASE